MLGGFLGAGKTTAIAELARRLVPFQGPMIPALARLASELSGADIPEEAFRPEAAPAYLRLTCRVVGEGGKVVAQSRDIDALLKEHGAKARAAWGIVPGAIAVGVGVLALAVGALALLDETHGRDLDFVDDDA